jgi:hypothetical protein
MEQTDRLAAGTFKHVAQISRRRVAVFGDRQGDQSEVQDGLYAKRRNRPREENGTCRFRSSATFIASRSTVRGANCQTSTDGTRIGCSASADTNAEVAGAAEAALCRGRPRHLSLIELERGDCHYPYGGDEEGEAITFCGHPRQPGSSYCAPHFQLSRNPVVSPEREAIDNAIWLRIVETA